jgi:hypothetical protein
MRTTRTAEKLMSWCAQPRRLRATGLPPEGDLTLWRTEEFVSSRQSSQKQDELGFIK